MLLCHVSEQWRVLVINLRHSLSSSSVPIIRKDGKIIRSVPALCHLPNWNTARLHIAPWGNFILGRDLYSCGEMELCCFLRLPLEALHIFQFCWIHCIINLIINNKIYELLKKTSRDTSSGLRRGLKLNLCVYLLICLSVKLRVLGSCITNIRTMRETPHN
jgi:hypothetical protein